MLPKRPLNRNPVWTIFPMLDRIAPGRPMEPRVKKLGLEYGGGSVVCVVGGIGASVL